MSWFRAILDGIFGQKDEKSSGQPASSRSMSSVKASSSSEAPVSTLQPPRSLTEARISQSRSCSLQPNSSLKEFSSSTKTIPPFTYPSRIPPSSSSNPSILFAPSDSTNQLRINHTAVQKSSSAISNPTPSSTSASSTTTSSPKLFPPSKPKPSPVPSNSTNHENIIKSISTQKGSSSSSISNPASSSIPSSFPKSSPLSKPTLLPLPPKSTEQGKVSYVWGQKETLPIYMIPEDIKRLIEKGIVPEVLRKPLSASTYRDYFAALIYAEDFYIEKWSEFHLSNVALEMKEASIYNKLVKNKNFYEDAEAEEKLFAEFEIDKVRERRPFLVSRDFVFAGPPGTKEKQFQGFVCRVVKGNVVLAEFQEDFHSQHDTTKRYDVSFSFNRESLKRAHKAIEGALDSSLLSFLFPDPATRKSFLSHPITPSNYDLQNVQRSAIRHISSFQGPPAYLVQGPLCLTKASPLCLTNAYGSLSKTGVVIREAVLQIYRTSPDCRILICAPLNRTCDVLMRSLKVHMPESEIFRANAAFREIDDVPSDILLSCPYEGECFVCPSISELQTYKVILSTFVSAFRLHRQGIRAGHFTHIFLVDASSATEPETIIALSGLVDNNTAVIVTGDISNHPGWIRSDLARKNGLSTSYFERLYKSKPYENLDPTFVTDLDNEQHSAYRFPSY